MSRLLLTQIKSIHIQLNALDPASSAVREFFSRITTRKAAASNPACEISHRVRIDNQPPVVALEYANGAKDLIVCRDMTCQDIIKRVLQRTEEMDTQAIMKSAGLEGLKIDSRAKR